MENSYVDNKNDSVGEPAIVGFVNEEDAQDNRETASKWSDFGFMVVPVAPDSTNPLVRPLPTSYDSALVEKYWKANPTHHVGFVVGENLMVAVLNSKQAQATLHQIERTFDRFPNLIVSTSTGFEHYYWLDRKAVVAPVVKPHNGHIILRTNHDIVLLPPHGGKDVVLNKACSISDFPCVGQAFVDAVQLHNQTALPNNLDGVEGVGKVVSHQIAQISPAGLDQRRESGKNGGIAHRPSPTSVPTEDGESGESGVQVSGTITETTFTAFGGQLAAENASGAPPFAIPVAVPLESGESGVLPVASSSAAPGSFMAIQAAALAAMPSIADDLPAIHNQSNAGDEVFTPKAAENPVVAELKSRGFYQTPLGSGMHRIVCLWANEHSNGQEACATYIEPDDLNPAGRYACSHCHSVGYEIDELLDQLGIAKMEARHKPVIRVVEGELHRIVDASERVLEARGMHYQSGGMIVSVATDPITGDPSIVPTNVQTLTRDLSAAASFEKFVGGKRGYKPCDPPVRQVSILLNAQSYSYLPVLAGLARQPYFREADGVLVTQPGYDKVSKLFGVFDPHQFVIPAQPTKETALSALELLQDLISEFRFANEHDQAAALSAMFTAVNRPSLPNAPANHVKAAMSSSGKSMLCETIVPFAGTAESKKISFPTSSEEATKSIMSTLVTCPAVVEFDDMTRDWIPHGIINRMLTSTHLTDRILGVSKNATVGTRTTFLSSGNNVGPVRDLLRRVLTINLDPRCATPATLTYKGNPVETLRKHRAVYVSAVLTINLAWKLAGSPRSNVSSIATYGGAWADFCRHPLIWLGLPDPATSLLEQVTSDPDSDNLGVLLGAWYKTFGTFATTVRKAIDVARYGNDDLQDAIHEFPVVERGEINPGKLGYVLKRNVNRIVGPMKFVEGYADGRKAWAVVVVDPSAADALFAATGKALVRHPTTTSSTTDVDESDLY